jgi:hypothetical protein
MMIRSWVLHLTFLLALTGCKSLNQAEERTLKRWLLCEECVEGERDSVVALGDRAVDALAEALSGPPKEGRNTIRKHAEAMYDRNPAPAPLGRKEYVELAVGNYVATYQKRAAIALRGIGTPRAHAVLVAALRDEGRYRKDVLPVLGESVGASISVVAGDSQHAAIDEPLKEKPVVLVADSVGHGLGDVRVLFRVDSGGGALMSDSVQRTDENGKADVSWRLGGDPADTVNWLRAVAAGQVVQIRATGHPPGPRIVFVVQPSNGTAGQPMAPLGRIAVQDAFGTLQTTFSQSAVATVEGTAIEGLLNIDHGEGTLPALIVPAPGTGLRLRVQTLGLPTAYSARFDIVP